MIPKIIHQVWLPFGESPMPAQWERYAQGWQELHPDYRYMFWDTERSRAFVADRAPYFLEIYESYRHPVSKVDALKYLLMLEFGGIYVDLDVECLKPIDSLLDGQRVLIPLEPEAHWERRAEGNGRPLLSSAWLASEPGADLWQSALTTMRDRAGERSPLDASGPFLLTRVWEASRERAGVGLLPPSLFYPLSEPECRSGAAYDLSRWMVATRESLGVHHWAGSWWGTHASGGPFVRQYTEGVRMAVRQPDLDEPRGGVLRGPLPDRGPSVACLIPGYGSFDALRNAIASFRNQSYANRLLVLCVRSVEPCLRELLDSLSDPRIRIFVLAHGQSVFTLDGLKAICAEIRCDYLAFWESSCLHEASRLALTVAAARASGSDAVHLSGHIEWSPEREVIQVHESAFDLFSSCLSVRAIGHARAGASLSELSQSLTNVARVDAPGAVCRLAKDSEALPADGVLTCYRDQDYERALRCLRLAFCLG